MSRPLNTTYSISDIGPEQVPGPDPFVICVGSMVVIQNRTNGQSFYMTYKTERRAEGACQRVRTTMSGARVVQRRPT